MSQLFSKRLRIEPLRAEHASVVFESLQHPAIYRFIPNDPPERAALQRRYDFLAGARSPDGREHWLNWVAFLRDTHTPVCTFQATLPEGERGSFAYVVFPAFWRQGYGREVVARMLEHLFEAYPVPELFAEIDTRNTGSIRLVESLGLVRVGVKADADFFKGAASDEYTYAVTRSEWAAR